MPFSDEYTNKDYSDRCVKLIGIYVCWLQIPINVWRPEEYIGTPFHLIDVLESVVISTNVQMGHKLNWREVLLEIAWNIDVTFYNG